MIIRENVPLAPLTTFHIGGSAQYFAEAHSEAEVKEAIRFAREKHIPLAVLGAGSNLLVSDEGVRGVVLKIAIPDITIETEGDIVTLNAGAGASWEGAVDAVCAENVWGIENLAGIPGTIGGAVVQNIGAYGAELSRTFAHAEGIDANTGIHRRVSMSEAAFAYRTSYFKKHRAFIITRVALRLTKDACPDISYPDLAKAQAAGVPLTTPLEISRAVRAIRAQKFPPVEEEGTAGSFFKNPIVSRKQFADLEQRFAGIVGYQQEDGRVKVSLAWLLDHTLHMKGYAQGAVRLYEKQPLVVVASVGARAADVDALAQDVAKRVFDRTSLHIEREVEMFG